MALAAVKQQHRAINILVVDDSKSMQDIIAFTIKSKGYEYELANNGEMALQLARSKHFDLILTDINMPEMDGFSLTKELRQLKSYSHTPILVLSTEFSPEKKQKGRDAGATGWIIKPFNGDKLIAAIEKLI